MQKVFFSVKNAYHVEWNRDRMVKGEPSRYYEEQIDWKLIWNLRVLRSIKHFIWKAANKILPTRSNICKKRIIDTNLYPLRQREEETTIHVLRNCLIATDVWIETSKPI